MSIYFSRFPKGTHYNNILATDITKRIDLRDSVLNDPYVYYPYQIEGDDRAEDIALYYYGDVRYTWLVWHCARVLDPYYDWPMTYRNFLGYIKKKYEDESGETGQNIISWTQDTTITDNILHYKNNDDEELLISAKTYELAPTLTPSTFVAGDWTAVRYYDYEEELNNDKRIINLLDNEFAPLAERQLKKLLENRVL